MMRENFPTIQVVDHEHSPIIITEVEKATKDLKAGKEPWNDLITTEMLKALDAMGAEMLHRLVNNMYRDGSAPADMMNRYLFAYWRNPKILLCTECRTLSLMSHVLQMSQSILLWWMIRRTEEKSSDLHHTSHKRRHLNMRKVCERYCEMNCEVYACFIDYEKLLTMKVMNWWSNA